MLAIPLKLEWSHIVDANGVALARLNEHHNRGAEIIAAVNSQPALFFAARNALLLLRSIDDSANYYGPEMDQLEAAIAEAEKQA
jgi:hypothetical protein